ncbi:nuclear transport factor 2 family protein [Microbacterium karelineae]|uniref:nuclear transport factor 2 family protein n=1 Tax=Microbacterium karelineae TaxID=2654283 RepID=UPI0012E9DCAD|nr:nuclear transport factor 2 family protein [Microbacterium karelineae]
MSIRTPGAAEVRAAAAAIVDAFAANDGERYFAAFARDAAFVFHPEPARLDDRASYERLWESWRESGWAVVACDSEDVLVQAFPGGAVFSHTVATRIRTADGEEAYRERESIVFRIDDDRLVAVHEHLSAISSAE